MMKTKRTVKLFCEVAMCIAGLTFFASCKSVARAITKQKAPFEVLSTDSAIYLKMPVQENLDLATKLLVSQASGFSEADARKVARQISVLYAGISSADDLQRVELYASGSYTDLVISSVFTEKNGFTEKTYITPASLEVPYYVHSSSKVGLSFPATGIMCASTKMTGMLDNYFKETINNEGEYVEWMNSSAGDSGLIKFYVGDASKFLTKFLNGMVPNAANFASNCNDVYGSLLNKSGENYLLTLKVSLKNEKTAPAFVSMIKLGLSLAGITVTQPDESTIQVENLPVTEKQIISLMKF